ncbi:TetR/AcrR family transcriptional regulator [Cellulomonas soli]|uniref:TetR/AcrR family transcriptional regulator n=1 Tax=Cellulomonas soli TaxID=931535 RepID=UPI003F84AE24
MDAAPQSPDPKGLKRTRGGRERMLTAAAELFRAHTLAGTSLQMIADRLGVSKPAIYHHFRSRDDIVATLMEPVIADVTTALESLRGTSAQDRPAAARGFYLTFVVRHRQVINMVFFDRSALPGDLPEQVDHLVDELADAMAAGRSTGAVAAGNIVIYGVAALVTRRTELDDAALGRLVREALTLLPSEH